MGDPFAICTDIYGECRCSLCGRAPCEAMVALAEDGGSAEAEHERMEAERQNAEDEIW